MAQIKNTFSYATRPDHTAAINRILEEWFVAKKPHGWHRPTLNKFMLNNNQVDEVREVVVHSFTMGDVEDPDLYAAEPLWKWQESEAGQWVMNNALDVPQWHRMTDPVSFGYKYYITAHLSGPSLTEYLLRHPT